MSPKSRPSERSESSVDWEMNGTSGEVCDLLKDRRTVCGQWGGLRLALLPASVSHYGGCGCLLWFGLLSP